jgi:hypothetical protein
MKRSCKHSASRGPNGTDRATLGLIFLVCAFVFEASACATAQSIPQQQALTITKLEAAKQIDLQNVRDGKSDKVQADDSAHQAAKAESVIEQLKQEKEVQQVKMDDALDVPPESLSWDSRGELIKELFAAQKCDELGEEAHDPGNDWLAWDSYREQRKRAGETSKALTLRVEVPWSEIQEALRVPDFR